MIPPCITFSALDQGDDDNDNNGGGDDDNDGGDNDNNGGDNDNNNNDIDDGNDNNNNDIDDDNDNNNNDNDEASVPEQGERRSESHSYSTVAVVVGYGSVVRDWMTFRIPRDYGIISESK